MNPEKNTAVPTFASPAAPGSGLSIAMTTLKKMNPDASTGREEEEYQEDLMQHLTLQVSTYISCKDLKLINEGFITVMYVSHSYVNITIITKDTYSKISFYSILGSFPLCSGIINLYTPSWYRVMFLLKVPKVPLQVSQNLN